MAMKASFLLCIVFALLFLAQNQASTIGLPVSQLHPGGLNPKQYGIAEGSLHPQDCAPRCGTRCSKTAYKKPCMFFCLKCCATCLCVPPGTFGNKEVCPCYNKWKTKRGGPKCP